MVALAPQKTAAGRGEGSIDRPDHTHPRPLIGPIDVRVSPDLLFSWP